MEIPVFVEPTPTGFRAATGSPLPLTADGPTADAAVAAVRELLAERLRAGGQVRSLTILTADEVAGAGRRLADNPLFDDWLRAVEEYRDRRDAEERAAEATGRGDGLTTLTSARLKSFVMRVATVSP